MAAIRHFPLLPLTFAFGLGAAPVHALQIGETEKQMIARHGAPAVEDHGRRLAMYFWEGWSAQVELKDGAVAKLRYRSNGYLSEAEIQSLLQANGGVNRWRETTSLGIPTRRWVRDDGVVATGDSARPTGMTFQAGGAGQNALSSAEDIVSDSFLKFEAATSFVAPKSVSSVPQNEPIVRSNAPTPNLRSEIGLRSEESAAETVTSPPALPQEPVPEDLQPPAVEAPVVPALAVQTLPGPRGLPGIAASIIFGLALAGAAILFVLAKSRRPRAVSPAPPGPPPAPKSAIRQTATATSAPRDLDSLRGDQIELLLGEIFRRQGYTIELSAAVDADLMLRRDGESIPVQTKDWKTGRITGREVREFYGLMASTAAPRGVMATSGSFSRDAREFAEGKSIELIDRAGLEERIAAVQRPDENFFEVAGWIGDFAGQARIFDPECPICRGAMAIRLNRSSGASAWACIGSQRCAGKREPRADLLTLPAAA